MSTQKQYPSMLMDRFAELTPKEFAYALEQNFRTLRPDPTYPAVNYLEAGLPLDMFDIDKDFLANLVRVSLPLALRISVSACDEQISSDRHADVLKIVRLFRSAIMEMFAELSSSDIGEMSLYDFAQNLLNRADTIHRVMGTLTR